ncbi:DUF2076 domain-containing protein [Neomegalonema sp.]|uniref:DUF2076 domain-containing protein n=1 Tax=Neomegalonema sp. TaxID=2039713 RepID=UPI002634EE60|nr:DUF2076 domain-containing protein [Neomegalonema sp.]MDD2869253.1 DUF2076 domain-containing protein [Neomegalonema sp.]
MDQNDQQAIEGLFGKLAQVERQNPQRDSQAESFISQAVARQPGAPYYMAQTIVVQEHALNSAQDRIAQLESELSAARQAPQGGGFLSRMFGGQPSAPPPARRQPLAPAPVQQGGGGGGFLAGAAQTAVGVAGGVLLGNAIAGMFGGDEAQAAEPEARPEAEPEPEAADEGDFGGFDEE